MEGTLEVRDDDEILERCGAGGWLGAVAFLDGGPRSADLVAAVPTVVLRWEQAALQQLLERRPALSGWLYAQIARDQARAMRRLTGAPAEPPPRAEAITLDRGTFLPDRLLIRTPEGDEVLSPTETRLLAYLAARPSRTIGHRTLLEEVWGYSAKVHSRTVYSTIHRLRQKVERDPAQPRHILSVAGVGYRFEH